MFVRRCSSSVQLNIQWSDGSKHVPLGQVKKKPHVSRPCPLPFLGPPLFLLFVIEKVGTNKKATGVTFTSYPVPLNWVQRELCNVCVFDALSTVRLKRRVC